MTTATSWAQRWYSSSSQWSQAMAIVPSGMKAYVGFGVIPAARMAASLPGVTGSLLG